MRQHSEQLTHLKTLARQGVVTLVFSAYDPEHNNAVVLRGLILGRHGEGDILAMPAVRKDGTQISIEFTIIMLPNEVGDVLGIAAMLRDVTKRFEETRALRGQIAARPA